MPNLERFNNHDKVEYFELCRAQRERIHELEDRICNQRAELRKLNHRIESLYRSQNTIWKAFNELRAATRKEPPC